jgi:hypothetical protein
LPSSVFDDDNPRQTRVSHACSLLLGFAGIGLVVLSAYEHFDAAQSRWRVPALSPLDIPLVLLLALFTWLLVHALRTGTALGRYGIIYRDEAPISFWLYIALTASSIIYLILAFFQ